MSSTCWVLLELRTVESEDLAPVAGFLLTAIPSSAKLVTHLIPALCKQRQAEHYEVGACQKPCPKNMLVTLKKTLVVLFGLVLETGFLCVAIAVLELTL